MNLHSLNMAVQALIWCQPTGRNGQAIGRAGEKGYHLYPATRGIPPAIGAVNQGYREYWSPWNTPVEANPRRPLCGELTTTARDPYLQTWAWTANQCANCARLARVSGTRTGSVNEMNLNDPWAAIPRHLRNTTPDPVTGR